MPVTGSSAWAVPGVTDASGHTTLSLSALEASAAAMGYGTGTMSSMLGSNMTMSTTNAPTATRDAGDTICEQRSWKAKGSGVYCGWYGCFDGDGLTLDLAMIE